MLSFFAFIVYIYIGIATLRLNKKSLLNRIFLFLCLSMAIWSFAYSFAYMALDLVTFYKWNKVSAIGWCSFSAISLYLVLVITDSKILKFKFARTIILFPAPVFLYLVIFKFGPGIKTPYLVEKFFYTGNFIYNFSYLLLCILIIFVWGVKSVNKRQKMQAKIVVIVCIIPFLFNLITQQILPRFGITIPLMGQIYSLIMIFGIYIAITKYRFLDIPISDITDEVLAEMVDLFILLSPKGNIIKVNSQALKLTGYSHNELIYKHITHILNHERIESIFGKNRTERTVLKFPEVNFKTKSKDTVPISVSCTLMIDPQFKDLLGVVIVGQDIRTTKELAKEIEKHKETALKLQIANAQIEKMNQELEEKNTILTKTNYILRDKSIRDSLTNLYNHRYIFQVLTSKIEMISANNQQLSLMMLDIDYFKKVNDQYGHQIGDRVLSGISELILNSVRDTDIVGRYGGEEFLVILPDTDIFSAALIAEKIRKSIEDYKIQDKNFKVTISIGLTQYSGDNTATIIRRADQLLYKCKQNGRNRVEVG